MTRGLTILLPTYNEADALPKVVDTLPLDALRLAGWEPRIVVADGRSTDRTQERAAELGLELIVQGPTAGKGFGMREGFARFLAHRDDVLVMLDADGTYAPNEMLRLLKHLDQGDYDVVIGSRLRGDIQPGAMSRVNWIGNHVLTWFAVALYRVFISDVCTGYWAFRRGAIEKMSLNSTELKSRQRCIQPVPRKVFEWAKFQSPMYAELENLNSDLSEMVYAFSANYWFAGCSRDL